MELIRLCLSHRKYIDFIQPSKYEIFFWKYDLICFQHEDFKNMINFEDLLFFQYFLKKIKILFFYKKKYFFCKKIFFVKKNLNLATKFHLCVSRIKNYIIRDETVTKRSEKTFKPC